MAEHSSAPVTRAPCDLDRFYQIAHQGCVTSRLPSDLYESTCFPTAFLTLCFIGWSHDMMANVPGKGLSSGTKLIEGDLHCRRGGGAWWLSL